jgi:hypothetical protein
MTGLRRLYRIVNAIQGDPDPWIPFGERRLTSVYEHVRRTAAERAFKLRDAPKEAAGILGEATKALSFSKRAVVAHGQRRTFLEFCARREEQPC